MKVDGYKIRGLAKKRNIDWMKEHMASKEVSSELTNQRG